MKFSPANIVSVANQGGCCRAATTFARAAGIGTLRILSASKVHCAATTRRYWSQRDQFHLIAAIAAMLSVTARAADTNALPALIPAYGEIPPTFWEQNGTVVIIDVIVFLAVAVAVAWEIFRPKPAPVLPPEKTAREALAKLQNQPEDGKLLSEVSQILRRYVGDVFGFPGGEMTTAEFCGAISRHEKIGTELSGAIASFLRECDVRKFSPANSATPVNAVHRALELVKNIHQHASTLNQGDAQP